MDYPDFSKRASIILQGGMPPAPTSSTERHFKQNDILSGTGTTRWKVARRQCSSVLRQNLASFGKLGVHFGALVFQEARVRGLDDRIELERIGQAGNGHII